MKTRLIFVRHAEAEGNLNRVFHGWSDSSITERGHRQAEKVAQNLKNVEIDVIYSSSLKRTLQTAQYIADIKVLPIIRTDKLKEINGGDWEGRSWSELPDIWPREHHTWENEPHIHQMPNGESMKEFQERLVEEVQTIIKNNKGKNICIVTHGTGIKALMCHFSKCELEEMLHIPWYDNTSITVIDVEDGNYRIITEGDASHLGSDLSTLQNQEWWPEYLKQLEDRKKKRQE
ncbi:MAG: histidine phosphatase family protein [Clostridia bacterium]|nr:histidine phosphatase family protein [Clostridia bacterium]